VRLLIVRLSALGDVVCGLPAASVVRRAVPDAEIVWAVDPRFAGVVECCRAVDRVVRLKPGRRIADYQVDGDFDIALDLQGLLKSALVTRASRAKLRLGYHWQREGASLLVPHVVPAESSLHIVEQVADVARAAVGEPGCTVEFALQPWDEDLDSVRAKLLEIDADPDRCVVLNAGAGWVTKRWPPASFAAVARALAEAGWSAVFIGGPAPADQAAVEDVCAAGAPDARSLLGQTSVRELIALIAMARAHVGGDTGSSHIAAALGVPAVGLYSITLPIRSCPYGQILRCHYDPVGLDRILPDDVLRTLFEALGYTAEHAIPGPHGSHDA